jgi:hypothetical protein
VTRDEARAIILALPHVAERQTFGSLSYKVNGKVLCGIGARTGPDDLYISGVGFDEAEALIERHPDVFRSTPHFAGAKYILARLAALEPDILRTQLERRWRQLAKKADVKAWDAR